MLSLADAKNDDGEWIMSPEQIRAEMAPCEPEYCDYCGGAHRQGACEDWYDD